MRTNKKCSVVRIAAFLALIVVSLTGIDPAAAQTSNSFDLKTFEGQTKFLNERQSIVVDRKDKAISNFLSEWRASGLRSAAPSGALDLLANDSLSLPDGFRRSRVPPDRTTVRLDRFLRQEVAPDDGRRMAEPRIPSGPYGNDIRERLMTAIESERQRNCGDAVRSLRQKIRFGSSQPGDRINDFHNLCLFAQPREANPLPLEPLQMPAIAACATAYNNYRKYCFAPERLGNAADRLKILAGIIVTKANDINRKQIVCSGLRVRRNLVLTARHCMAAFPSGNAGGAWFYPVGSSSQPPVGIPIEQVLPAPNFAPRPVAGTGAAYRRLTDRDVWHNDVLLLKLANQPSTPQQPLGLRRPTTMESVVLGGYQRLIFYAMLIQARLAGRPLFDDEDLLSNGSWRQAFEFDASPTCLMIPYTADEARRLSYDPGRVFGHICQSLRAASGSVLVALTNNEVLGVHIHARPDTELEALNIAVESTRPRNTAVIMNPQLRAAIEANQ
jgi:hypothetical protein